ncbi:hypothetical protein MLD38_008557 [Melastoma candidum]|uniref:Uncharacterized protein n=1 Tax=Melastoma candidum TaxID=119954 RepID=A0ACB9RUN9_9MYRT|nr:hypothetical protein MLD38_008557 [Melastoma candidum]
MPSRLRQTTSHCRSSSSSLGSNSYKEIFDKDTRRRRYFTWSVFSGSSHNRRKLGCRPRFPRQPDRPLLFIFIEKRRNCRIL